MRTIRRNMILAAAAGLAATAHAQLQIVTNLPGAWVAGVDAAANQLGVISQGDDNAAPVTIPAAYQTGVLNAGANFAITNGRLINLNNTAFGNVALGAAGPFGFYPHWDDLRTDDQTAAVPASGIYAMDTGTAFVVQWNFDAYTPGNSGTPSGALGYASMQVQIFPTGSAIVAQYLYQGLGTMTGQSATIGCVTQTFPQVVPYSLNTATSISDNTVLSVVPVPSATGSCCKPDGTCAEITQFNCTAAGGVYNGDATLCINQNCPQPGACCKADGSCSTLLPAACATASGVFTAGTTCASFICPGGFGFSKTIPGTFTDISATGTPITYANIDDDTQPFTSSVTNALVTNANLYVCTNGFISDSATFNTFTNGPLPTASATFGLFANWDDLYMSAPGSVVHLGLVEGGVPVHIIQWDQAATFFNQAGPRGTFQVKIFAPGGPALVQYLYQGMAWDFNGNSSTVGVQWSATGSAQRSFSNTNAAPPPPVQIPDGSVLSIIGPPTTTACYANCDHSTILPCLNVQDFGCFLNKFAAGDTYANCDASTIIPVLNVQDFGCFLNKFASGCSSC